MPALPLAGPSAPLRNSAEVRRIVNWEPIRIESGTGKGGAQSYLKQSAGLRFLANIGTNIRALKCVHGGRLFAATDTYLKEIRADWTTTNLGGLAAGGVSMDDNETQLGIAVGPVGYAFDLTSDTLTTITSNWPGSTYIGVLDGWGVLPVTNSNHFNLTNLQDFTVLDPLDFAAAESSPGDIVGALVKHREAIFLKERTGEVWYNAGTPDFPLARNDSAVIEVGCIAGKTLLKLGGIAYWLGRDETGVAGVWAMLAYQPQKVSSDALAEQLATLTLTQLQGATAWAYHHEEQLRYVLNVPGLKTSWVYNVAAGIWHERGEWVNGDWAQWRPTCHAYAFGKHIVGDAKGNLYQLDPTYNKFGSDVMRRLWRSPHSANPQTSPQRFSSFEVLCDTGAGLPDGSSPTMLMRYSNDGAKTWQNWIDIPLGAIGETQARARETGLGSAKDRVWEFVVTDDVQCNPATVLVNEL